MEEFEAFMECAKQIADYFKNLTGLKICEYSLSHRYMTFIEYDTIHNKVYLFSERDYYNFFKYETWYVYFSVNPTVIDNKFATMALMRLDLNVNGKLIGKVIHTIAQSKIGG